MASINTDMPRISRNNDLASTGHACTRVVGVRATQFTVFANGIAIARPGDPCKPHTILRPGKPPKCVGHKAKINRGSRTVFAQGRPVARVGDSTDRGRMIRGSGNVQAGG